MNWQLVIVKSARKALRTFPDRDAAAIGAALEAMQRDPRAGDTVHLHDPRLPAFRRRVGAYRILFDIHADRRLVVVSCILRRTTTTYR